MGMFDTIYAELVCPFCGWQYRHTPLSWEQAKRERGEWKERELKHTQPSENRWGEFFRHSQAMRARADGYPVREGRYEREDILAWIEQLDSPENIERWRMRKELGLAAIQTKAFDSVLQMYFIGDEVPAHWGHYFIEEGFPCQGCREKNEREYVKVWIEIEDRRIKAVLTHNPETGQPEKEPPLPVKEIVGDEAAMTSFKVRQAKQKKYPEYVIALNELELGYQITRLRIRRGLTRAQLAKMVDVQEATLTRLESGRHIPSLSLLRRIAAALNARLELRFLPDDATRT
ncbi:predicted transcriptional regulators [Anaerolinea thermolimosa]|nr:predicted transcriptional regulators [Anaerolinea thermolimosa]